MQILQMMTVIMCAGDERGDHVTGGVHDDDYDDDDYDDTCHRRMQRARAFPVSLLWFCEQTAYENHCRFF